MPRALNTWQAPKCPSNIASTFFNTVVHFRPKDRRFEHGGAELVSYPGRHLTSVRPCSQSFYQKPFAVTNGVHKNDTRKHNAFGAKDFNQTRYNRKPVFNENAGMFLLSASICQSVLLHLEVVILFTNFMTTVPKCAKTIFDLLAWRTNMVSSRTDRNAVALTRFETKGARMPPTRANMDVVPMPTLRTTVGKSSDE